MNAITKVTKTAEASRDASSANDPAGPITRFCIAASAVIHTFKASEAAARCAPTIAAARAKCDAEVAEAKAKCKEEVAAIRGVYEGAKRDAEVAKAVAVAAAADREAKARCAEAVAEAQANCPDWKAAKAKYDADIDKVMVQANASQGLDAALDQIEGMRGSADVPVRLKVLKPGTDKKDETTGTVRELGPQCQELGEAGCNMYVFLQPIECAGKYANGTHVTHIEVIAADGDAAPLPTKFHVEPSFILFNRDTFRWWLYWRIEGLDKEDFTPMQKRLIAEYDSDPSVHDRVRVGRLAGGPRWKDGRRYGEYEYIHGTGATTTPEDHEGLPQIAAAKEKNTRAKSGNADPGERREVPLSEWPITPDLPRNIEKAIKFIRAHAKSTKKDMGNDLLYRTACMMKDFGLSRPKAMEVLEAEYLPECDPPWPVNATYKGVVRSAYRSTVNEPGCKTPEYESKMYEWNKSKPANENGEAVEAGTAPAKRTKFRFADAEEQEQAPPVSYLIDNCLPNDAYCALVGGKGTFKTFLAFDMALSIATGAGELWRVADTGPVLFAAGEGKAGLLARRRAWETRHYNGQRVPNFYTVNPVPHVEDLAGFGEAYQEFIAGAKRYHPRYKLVIIDTVGRSMQGVNENVQEHASKFTRLVDALRNDLGCTVLAIQHSGHAEEMRARGSSVFGADADTVLLVQRAGKAFEVDLHMDKQKDGPEWEKPKKAMLEAVNGSLVVRAASPFTATGANPAAPATETGRTRRGNKHDGRSVEETRDAIERHLALLLKPEPGAVNGPRYSNPGMCDHLEKVDEIGLTARVIGRHLLELRGKWAPTPGDAISQAICLAEARRSDGYGSRRRRGHSIRPMVQHEVVSGGCVFAVKISSDTTCQAQVDEVVLDTGIIELLPL